MLKMACTKKKTALLLFVVVYCGCLCSTSSALVVQQATSKKTLQQQAAKASASQAPANPKPADVPGAAPDSGPPAAQAGEAESTEAQALVSYKTALKWHTKAEELAKTVEEQAYQTAHVAAQSEVTVLQTEAEKYYEGLMSQLTAHLQPTGADAAAANAARPHLEEVAKAQGMVIACNNMAAQAVLEANNMQNQAVGLAMQAQAYQASGFTMQASALWNQAYSTLHNAAQRKASGMKFRTFAENINTLVPSYQTAAEIAATNARA